MTTRATTFNRVSLEHVNPPPLGLGRLSRSRSHRRCPHEQAVSHTALRVRSLDGECIGSLAEGERGARLVTSAVVASHVALSALSYRPPSGWVGSLVAASQAPSMTLLLLATPLSSDGSRNYTVILTDRGEIISKIANSAGNIKIIS
jgi:hypothetical protein